MPEAVRKQLEGLKDWSQAECLAEVIRRAVALYDLLLERTQSGGRVIIRTDTTDQEVLLV